MKPNERHYFEPSEDDPEVCAHCGDPRNTTTHKR